MSGLSAVVLHYGWVVLLPGVIGIVHVVRRKGVVLAHLGGGLAVVGLTCFSGLIFGDFFSLGLAESGLPTAQADKILEETGKYPGAVFGYAIPMMLAMILGMPMLAVAAWRAGLVHWAVPIVVPIGLMSPLALPYGLMTVVLSVPFAAGFGWIGVRLLRMSDDEWAGTAPVQPAAPLPSGNVASTL